MSRQPGENLKKSYYFFSYCPLQILALKACNQDISKTVGASSFDLGLLIEDNKKITWSKFKKKVILFFLVIALCKFWHWKLLIKISRKLLKLAASNMVSWQTMMSRLPDENLKKSYFIFLRNCPLQILALETCSQDISKTITASSLKLCQLIIGLWVDYLVKIKKKTVFYFFSYCPLQIWVLKTWNQDISKIIIASSFKHGQLVEDDSLVKI